MTKHIKETCSVTKTVQLHDSRAQLIFNATEDILIHMEDNNISKADLSRKLGKSRPYISGLFSGERNMTLNTFSDICFTVGLRPEIVLVNNVGEAANYSPVRHTFMTPNTAKGFDLWHEAQNNIIDLASVRKRKEKRIFDIKAGGDMYAYA